MLKIYGLVLSFALFKDIYQVCGYQQISLKTRQINGWKTPDTLPYTHDINVPTRMACVALCTSKPNCTAVDHHGDTCAYFNTELIVLKEDSTSEHFVVFVRNVYMLAVGEQEYTLTEARDVCTDIGVRLAYRSELNTLYSKGYQRCACAWLQEGNAMYLMQIPKSGCGNRVGLMDCGVPSLASAWCYMT